MCNQVRDEDMDKQGNDKPKQPKKWGKGAKAR
jgi:hypothetical protein